MYLPGCRWPGLVDHYPNQASLLWTGCQADRCSLSSSVCNALIFASYPNSTCRFDSPLASADEKVVLSFVCSTWDLSRTDSPKFWPGLKTSCSEYQCYPSHLYQLPFQYSDVEVAWIKFFFVICYFSSLYFSWPIIAQIPTPNWNQILAILHQSRSNYFPRTNLFHSY